MDAESYWRRYYGGEFVFGLGTEDVIALLGRLPPVDTWIDVGSGSDSLLWACALSARSLHAVDADTERLDLLRRCATLTVPPPAYRTVLRLAGRTPADWPAITARLRRTRTANCLTGVPPVADHADLVTQFGLLGLCRDAAHFHRCFLALTQLLGPGGWFAGANWQAADSTGRVRLDDNLYQTAAAASDLELVHLRRIPSADPAYPQIWAYLARQPAISGPGAVGHGLTPSAVQARPEARMDVNGGGRWEA